MSSGHFHGGSVQCPWPAERIRAPFMWILSFSSLIFFWAASRCVVKVHQNVFTMVFRANSVCSQGASKCQSSTCTVAWLHSMAWGADPGTICVGSKLSQLGFLPASLKGCCRGPQKCVHNDISVTFSVPKVPSKLPRTHDVPCLRLPALGGMASQSHFCVTFEFVCSF